MLNAKSNRFVVANFSLPKLARFDHEESEGFPPQSNARELEVEEQARSHFFKHLLIRKFAKLSNAETFS